MAVSGCHAPLASQGTPHSNFQATNQATKPGPKPSSSTKPNPVTGSSPKPGVSPSPSPSPTEDLTQESLTLLSSDDVQNEDAKKTVNYDGRTLQITLLEDLKISKGTLEHNEDDDQDSYVAYVENGQWTSKDDAKKSAISCIVHYTLVGAPEDKDLVISKGEVYTFTRDEGKRDNEGNRHAVLKKITGANEAGEIVRISCEAPAKDSIAPSVDDLVVALGGTAAVQASVKMPAAPAPKPAAATVPAPTTHTAAPPASTMGRHISSVTSDSNDNSQISGKSTVKKSVLVEHDDSMLTARPNFAFQLEGSMNAFGGSTISPAEQGVTSKAALIEAEYQPSFLQGLGVLGIGPSIGMYPTTGGVVGTGQQVVNGPTSIWEVGGQVRYQFRYVTEQMIVPFVGYNYQRLHYNINQGGGNSGLNIAGGSAGLSVLLNRLDETAALDLYRNTGISRLYLVAELKNLQGSDDNVAIAGNSFFFGIRCEL